VTAGYEQAAASSGTYLDRIVPVVLRRLDERKALLPLEQLRAMAGVGPRGSFAGAVRAPGLSLIAEVKRASPSKGPIRPDLDVAQLVAAYEAAGARAISVLTEQDHFAGSLDDLDLAVRSSTLPLLRKDFVLDAYQVHEARVRGASAVLLIAALLSDVQLRFLSGLAFELGLDVLLEVHDSAEMRRALAVDGVIVGVNNRDLSSFEVSLDRAVDLACMVPPDRLLVGESGIRQRADIERLAGAGVDGVLVGETIVRDADPGAVIRTLMDPLPRVGSRTIRCSDTKEAR
jgi:indole-3-glycerol phosphate synthase